MIMDGMTGIMQVVRVAIMIIYIGVKITITVFSNHKDEIIYWGEDGAIGTPPRLQLIRDEILQSGTTSGWEVMDI